MKNISSLMLVYICVYIWIYLGVYFYLLHVYIYIGYIYVNIFLGLLCYSASLILWNGLIWLMYILVVTDIVCKVTVPFVRCWKNYKQTFKLSFIFKSCVFSDHNLISKYVIMVNYSRVFVDCVFLHLCLFTLIYVFPIHYVVYWEDHISSKHYLDQNFYLSLVICRVYRKISYR